MKPILSIIGEKLHEAGMTSDVVKAGCAKCGACSTLKSFEIKKKTFAIQ